MSSEWYYQLFGEEFGPVTLEDLEELVTSETLSPTDLVRQGTSGGWKAVSSIARGNSGLESPTVATATFESDSAVRETGWFYESLGCTLGPISFEELVQLAESGELGADDDVWMGEDGKRRRAGSIGRLMAAMPFQSSTVTIENRPTSPSLTDTDSFESKTALREAAPSRPTPPTPVAAPPTQDQLWYAWIRGQEFGPVSLQDLQQWYRDQRLTMNDAVKPGLYGAYQPVATATFLWSAPAAPPPAPTAPPPAPVAPVAPAAVVPAAPVAPKPAAPVAVEKPAAPPQPVKPVEPVAKVEAPKPAPKVEVAEPKPEPVKAVVPVEAPKPAVEEVPKPAPASFSSPPAWSAPKPMAAPMRAAPPKPAPKRSSGGGGFDLGGMLKGLGGGSTGIAIGAVVVVGLLYGGWMLIPESQGNLADYYNTMNTMAAEIGKMRAANAGDAEWQQFGQKSMQTLEPISKDLEASLKSAPKSSLKPIRQNLFYAAKYRFKDVFAKPLKEKSRSEEDVKLHLTEAARLMKLPAPSL